MHRTSKAKTGSNFLIFLLNTEVKGLSVVTVMYTAPEIFNYYFSD